MSLLIAFQEFEADGLTTVHVIEDFTRLRLRGFAFPLLSSNFSLPGTLSLVNTKDSRPVMVSFFKKKNPISRRRNVSNGPLNSPMCR